MARIRTIKPDFWTSDQVTKCSRDARLLFIGTWNFADDNGNLSRSSDKLKRQVFPDDDDVDTEALLASLITHGLLIEYSVSGELFLHIDGFKRHQVINRPSAAKCPEYNDSLRTHGGKGREGKGRGVVARPSDSQPAGLQGVIPEKQNKPKVSNEATTAATWARYSTAYEARYSVAPVRNAKVNGMLKALVDRLGATEAPEVAAWYVRHQAALYVRSKHAVELLLRDAEGLRTEWATGRQVTQTEAGQVDKTAATGQVFTKLIDESRQQAALLPGDQKP